MSLVNKLDVHMGDLILLKSDKLDIQRVGFVSYCSTYEVGLDNAKPFGKSGSKIKYKLFGRNYGLGFKSFSLKHFDSYEILRKYSPPDKQEEKKEAELQ